MVSLNWITFFYKNLISADEVIIPKIKTVNNVRRRYFLKKRDDRILEIHSKQFLLKKQIFTFFSTYLN